MNGGDCVPNKTLCTKTDGRLDLAHRPQFMTPALYFTSKCFNVLELHMRFKNHLGIKCSRITNFQKNGFLQHSVVKKALFWGNQKTKPPGLSLGEKKTKKNTLNFLTHRLLACSKSQFQRIKFEKILIFTGNLCLNIATWSSEYNYKLNGRHINEGILKNR